MAAHVVLPSYSVRTVVVRVSSSGRHPTSEKPSKGLGGHQALGRHDLAVDAPHDYLRAVGAPQDVAVGAAGRRSISHTGTLQSRGQNQRAKSSGLVHASNTRRRGRASKTRVITISRSPWAVTLRRSLSAVVTVGLSSSDSVEPAGCVDAAFLISVPAIVPRMPSSGRRCRSCSSEASLAWLCWPSRGPGLAASRPEPWG